MFNQLPKVKNSKGFTLIELLVVIAIIAIIAVVGMAIFSGQQARARDARRRSDIQAIGQAMEASKGQAVLYPAITTGIFSGGIIPNDPVNVTNGTTSLCTGGATNSTCQYCFTTSATPINACTGGTSNFITAGSPAPAAWTASATWTVCANLEGGGSVCRSNSQ